MSKVWKLYKARVIAVLSLALLGGYSLMTWLYFEFEQNHRITYGSAILHVGILGMLLSVAIFFLTATFVVNREREDSSRQASASRNHVPGDGNSDWAIDPAENAMTWGGSMSLIPGGTATNENFPKEF